MKKERINLGIMIDVSRGSVPTVKTVKEIINHLCAMNYHTLMLYTEDTYEIPEDPYFGYLRGRYSQAELQEIDAYAKTKDIELVPCIQTLAHLNGIVRWQAYAPFVDVNDILLAGDERTYALIERMFSSLEKSFTSRLVHLGMDEAHMVGLGRYLDQHGYTNRVDIILKHLNLVCDIAKKHGFKPIMWSDMFFRLASHGSYKPVEFPQEVIDLMPEGLGLVYWDYYRTEEEPYEKMIESHLQFKDRNPMWFATGGWNWRGFAPCSQAALKRIKPALQACKKKKVENIFTTLWGDDGGECSILTTLPVLYYTMMERYGKADDPNFKEQFHEMTGEDYDAMLALSLPNEYEPYDNTHPVAKVLFYQDPFLGLFDTYVEENMVSYYRNARDTLLSYRKTSASYGYLFQMEAALCDAIQAKCMLGVKTRAAYKAKDLKALSQLAKKEYPLVLKKVNAFYLLYKKVWFTEFKPFGWEAQDIRLGGLMKRIETCKERLELYIKGELDRIDELEETILPYYPWAGIPEEQVWQKIVTPFKL